MVFNEYGFLPEGIHAITLAEFEKEFGFNLKRKDMIIKGLKPFIQELAVQNIEEVFLDGSFVTQTENPKDIDAYILTDTQSPIFEFIAENSERWQAEYRVECYPAFTDIEGEESSREWLDDLFSQSKESSNKKGYVLMKIKQGGVPHVSHK